MIPIKTTNGEMMKKLIVPLLFLTFFNPFSVSAAMQVLGTKANTAPGHLDADANFSKQNANNAELQAIKADKDKVVRLWADHPDGTQIGAKTLVAYDGKIYTALQAFDKVSSSATPDVLTAYFKVAGGVTNYSELDGKPTLGTAAAQNVGTSVGNIPQIGSDGKIPSGVYTSNGLSSQPTATGQSIISSGAAAYGWLPNVPLTTNPSGLLVDGIINLTGFQPLDPALTAASALDGSGPNKMNGTDGDGVVGIMSIPGKPTIQATPLQPQMLRVSMGIPLQVKFTSEAMPELLILLQAPTPESLGPQRHSRSRDVLLCGDFAGVVWLGI